MIELTVYLVECSLLLGLLYSIYWVLLRKGRLFTLNRFYLLTIFTGSFLIPLIDIDLATKKYTYIEAPVTTLSDARTTYYEKMDEWMVASASSKRVADNSYYGQGKTSWLLVGLISIYLTGMTLTLIRMGWIYFTLMTLKRKGSLEERGGLTIVKLDQSMAPFSFMKYVFVSKEQTEEDAFQHILDHEQTHIRERHSIDLMIVQFLAALQWFNPAAWWLIKSLKTTHEYIADQQMISKGYSVVEYQALLLQQLISNNSYGLVHNFNLSFIKNRIAMMKIQKIGWTSKTQMALATTLSMLIAFITIQCNAKLDEQTLDVNEDPLVEFTPAVRPDDHASTDKFGHDEFELLIVNDQLIYQDEVIEVSDLENLIHEARLKEFPTILLNIDANQKMRFVIDVQYELRRIDRRKILYGGRSENGSFSGIPMLLPPHPTELKVGVKPFPKIEEMETRGEIVVERLDFSNGKGIDIQQQVYDFITPNIEQKLPYVVSAKATDEMTFQKYFENLSYINHGFNQYYQERADELYEDVDFLRLDLKNPEDKAKYNAIRKGAPRAISIAERD